MKYTLPIIFAMCTAICWGLYGPTVANARSPEKLWSPFKPYVFIGVAYLVLACGGGLVGMKISNDSTTFSGPQSPAAIWGFAAGTLGAIGALCLTSAMLSFTGPPKPQLVMPIVFGGAVSITAIVSIIQLRAASTVSPWLWVGMVTVVIGIVLVAYNTHHGGPGHSKPTHGDASVSTPLEATSGGDSTSY